MLKLFIKKLTNIYIYIYIWLAPKQLLQEGRLFTNNKTISLLFGKEGVLLNEHSLRDVA